MIFLRTVWTLMRLFYYPRTKTIQSWNSRQLRSLPVQNSVKNMLLRWLYREWKSPIIFARPTTNKMRERSFWQFMKLTSKWDQWHVHDFLESNKNLYMINVHLQSEKALIRCKGLTLICYSTLYKNRFNLS